MTGGGTIRPAPRWPKCPRPAQDVEDNAEGARAMMEVVIFEEFRI